MKVKALASVLFQDWNVFWPSMITATKIRKNAVMLSWLPFCLGFQKSVLLIVFIDYE